MRNRGQTETLGFVFVFALIVSMIGVTFTAGFSGLYDVRETERLNNAERAFEVLADNVEDIVHRNAPSRATEIKVSGADVGFGEPIDIAINIEGSQYNWTFEPHPITYEAEAGTIIYSAGGIIRQDDGNGVVARESTYLFDKNRTLLPVVEMRAQGSGGVGGETTVLLRNRVADRQVIHVNETDGTVVWMNLTTPRADVWRAHLSENTDVICQPVVSETLACHITTDKLLITMTRIDAEFS